MTGDAAIMAGVSALAGWPVISNICTGVRGIAGSSTGVQPSLASQAGQQLPYDNRFVVRNADGSINPDLSYAAGANFNIVENWGFNGQLEYDLASDMQLKSITAYRKLDSRFGADVGGDPSGAFQPTFGDDEKQFTQEIQLIGKGYKGRWKYVLGGFFLHETDHHAHIGR